MRVRHKRHTDADGYFWYGHIAYYDSETRLVWVVWEPSVDSKIGGASGVPSDDLVKVNY